ncbi:UNVERIFIED_CONTAM: hypothetical protein NCL1_12061 [Trichonephila clavipes]
MLNDNEIITSMHEESDPVDYEIDEDEDNNDNENGYGVIRTTIRVKSDSNNAAQENQRPSSEKTKVYNGTAKNK